MAKTVADIISRHDKQTILEGQEPAEFWVALGGKAPYANSKRYRLISLAAKGVNSCKESSGLTNKLLCLQKGRAILQVGCSKVIALTLW